MSKSELGRLKTEISAARSQQPPRYPEALWKAGARYSDRRLKEGVRLAKAAAELGLKLHTLNYWREKQRRGQLKQKTLRPVTLRPEPTAAATELVVLGPGGLSIKGMDVKTLAALLRELS